MQTFASHGPAATLRRVGIAVASGALLSVTAAPALAATHAAHVQRGVVLAASGVHLTVVDARFAVHRYTVAGTVPAGLKTDAAITFTASGATAQDVKLLGTRASFSYLGTVAHAGAGRIAVTTAARATVTYRSAAASSVRRGQELLVSVRTGRHHRRLVSVRAAAGSVATDARHTTGIVTRVARHGALVTVLSPAGVSLTVHVPARIARLARTSGCATTSLYYRSHQGRLTAALLVVAGQKPVAGCATRSGGYGFVTAVATNDRWLTVKTATHGTLRLTATGRALRKLIDAASVTNYVSFTYTRAAGRLALATLRDSSSSQSGTVISVSRKRRSITVKSAARHVLRMRFARQALIAGVKIGDKVDIDYYRAATGPLVLVNCDDQGPAQAGGNGGGPADPKGSGGSSGSGGSGGSAGGSSGSAGGSSGAAG